MNRIRFDAPWDWGLKLATGLVFAVTGAIAVLLAWAGMRMSAVHASTIVGLVPVIFLLLPILLLWAAWLEAPRAFTVDDAAIRVERPSGTVAIPLADVREVRELPPRIFFRREGGLGGFFGYSGNFYSTELGRVRLHATRSDGRVLLVTGEGPVVLTPEAPERFVEEVRARLGPR